MGYAAFISYSHSSDNALSAAIYSSLQRLAKPWYRLRALRLFRESLAANPALWSAIEEATTSDYFLLMASPAAAASPWVRRELEWWLTNRGAHKILILVTAGDIAWNEAAGDFDWDQTTALHPALKGRFTEEPLYVDLRWAQGDESYSLRHSRFRSAILDIAASVRGVPKEDLDGEDVRQHRRTRVLATGAIVGVLAFGVLAMWQAVVANNARQAESQQRQEAFRQRDLAVERQKEADAQRRIAEDQRGVAEHRPKPNAGVRLRSVRSNRYVDLLGAKSSHTATLGRRTRITPQ